MREGWKRERERVVTERVDCVCDRREMNVRRKTGERARIRERRSGLY